MLCYGLGHYAYNNSPWKTGQGNLAPCIDFGNFFVNINLDFGNLKYIERGSETLVYTRAKNKLILH